MRETDEKHYYDSSGYVTSYVVCKHCGSSDTRALLGTVGGGGGGKFWCNDCKRIFYWYWDGKS